MPKSFLFMQPAGPMNSSLAFLRVLIPVQTAALGQIGILTQSVLGVAHFVVNDWPWRWRVVYLIVTRVFLYTNVLLPCASNHYFRVDLSYQCHFT
jgi:hypothetical protein